MELRRWNFGDGKTSNEQNPVHTYNKAGKYTVSLKIWNAAGTSTIKKSYYIYVKSSLKAPIADFSVAPAVGKVPLKVIFTDKTKGMPASWKWSFGDETFSTAKDPVHIYSKTGKYTVTLTAKNARGTDTETKSKYIIVSNRK